MGCNLQRRLFKWKDRAESKWGKEATLWLSGYRKSLQRSGGLTSPGCLRNRAPGGSVTGVDWGLVWRQVWGHSWARSGCTSRPGLYFEWKGKSFEGFEDLCTFYKRMAWAAVKSSLQWDRSVGGGRNGTRCWTSGADQTWVSNLSTWVLARKESEPRLKL